MEKMAAAVGTKGPPVRGPAPDDGTCRPNTGRPSWTTLAPTAGSRAPGASGRPRRLSQIPQRLLRVGCRRCARIVEIQKADDARLYGPDAIWWDVGQRLLDNTQRTGRHE
jgi:hypothetical protein